MNFDGATFDERLDAERLTSLFDRVLALMSDGEWRTLSAIADRLGEGSEASISARLRDFRKPKFGGHIVDRVRIGDSGVFKYKVIINRYGF